MVTAEFAVALPAVVIVLGVLLGAGAAVLDTVRCVDAARAGARAAARHEPPTEVVAAARATAPEGADVQVAGGGEEVRVTVSARVDLVVPGLPPLTVRGTAAADVEEAGPSPVGALALVPALCGLGRRRRRARHARGSRRRARPGPPRDRGSGTVLALALVAASLTLTAGTVQAGTVFVARHRAAAAADLAALAAAGAGGCGRAVALAEANGARLVACSVSAGGVADVGVAVDAGALGAAVVEGVARAGPAEFSVPP